MISARISMFLGMALLCLIPAGSVLAEKPKEQKEFGNPLDDFFMQGAKPEKAEYYDTTLPREISVKPYEGERYEATVPDTEDLALYAERALNAGTRLVLPEQDYTVCQVMHFNIHPAVLEFGHSSIINIQPKYSEALPMLRTMTGLNHDLEMDGKVIGTLVRFTGKDGLVYHPIEDRPYAYIDPITEKSGKPWADVFGEGRQLRAYATWYQHDRNPLWKKLAERKIDRLLELAVRDGKTLHFRRTRGYSPWYVEEGKGELIALGDVGAVYEDLTGGAAAFMACWTPQGAGTWYQVTGSEKARELADGLARYVIDKGKVIDPETGEFLADHPALVTHILLSILSYGLATDQPEMIEWSRKGFEEWKRMRDPDATGVILSVDSSQIPDMIQAGLLLSRAGYGNYWDRVDRWLRNSHLPMQILPKDVERAMRKPKTRAGDPYTSAVVPNLAYHTRPLGKEIALKNGLPPAFWQPADGNERCMGGFFSTLENRGSGIGDGNGNGWRGLYLVWDSIIYPAEDGLKVNLLLNRASPWADVDSYVPYEGKVVIHIKTDQPDLQVRIPDWSEREETTCRVNDQSRQGKWTGADSDYFSVGEVKKGDTVVIEFPIKQWTIHTNLNVSIWFAPDLKMECDVTLKGNTVIQIDREVGYPMFTHDKFRGDEASMRKVSRFVSKERFVW